MRVSILPDMQSRIDVAPICKTQSISTPSSDTSTNSSAKSRLLYVCIILQVYHATKYLLVSKMDRAFADSFPKSVSASLVPAINHIHISESSTHDELQGRN